MWNMYMGQFDINFTSPCVSASLAGIFEELSVLTSLCTSLSVLWFEPCDVDVAVVTTVLFTAWFSSVFFSLTCSSVTGTGFVEVGPFLSRKTFYIQISMVQDVSCADMKIFSRALTLKNKHIHLPVKNLTEKQKSKIFIQNLLALLPLEFLLLQLFLQTACKLA